MSKNCQLTAEYEQPENKWEDQ